MSLDKHIREASKVCSNITTRSLVANLSTLCPDFDEIFAIKSLKASVAERIQQCLTQSGNKAANLCKQCSPPELQMRLLEELLSREDWRGLKGSFREVFFASHKLSTVPPYDNSFTNNMEVNNVNVLSFGEDLTMEVANEGVSSHFPSYLNSLKVLEDALKDSSRKKSASITQDRLCSTKDSLSLGSSELNRRWSGIRKYDGSTLLAHVSTLLDRCPEVLLQLNKWHRFIGVLIAVAKDSPKEGSKVALRYFRLAGPQQRGALLMQMLSDIPRSVQKVKEQQMTSSWFDFFFSCILRCIDELPENWLGLLDDEVGVLFSSFLNNVVLPQLEFISQVNPSARWVRNWSRRPTFERLVKEQLLSTQGCHMTLVQLQAAFPNQYALSLVAYFLPILLPSSCRRDGTVLCTAARENCCENLRELLSEFIRRIIEVPVVPPSVQSPYKFTISSCAYLLSPTKLWYYIRFIISIIQSLLCNNKVNQQEDTESRVCWLLSLAECLLHSVRSVKLCADATCKPLLMLVNVTKNVDSRAVSESARSFWQSVLSRHWRSVLDHVLPTLLIGRGAVSSPVFTLGHLVSISRDLDGWFHIRGYFMQHVDAVSCVDGDMLLHHIIGLSSVAEEAKFPPQFDTSIFTLISRWSTHPSILEKLLKASRRCCEHYFGLPRNGDLLRFFFLPPGGLEVPSDFQFVKSPLEQNICKNSDYLKAFFHIRVFLFLNLISLDGKDIAHRKCSDTTDTIFPLFMNTCLNAFLDSFVTTNNSVSTDDTRLFLLCLVSLALFFSSQCEEALWHSGSPAHQRLTQLCDVFQQRAGIDPLFIVGRFLTSGKGRKRLLPILLNGFNANLTVDAVQTFQPFAYRKPFSTQLQPLQMTVNTDYALLVIEKAFSHESNVKMHENTLVEFISLWVQACSGMDKVPTPEHVSLLLRKRSLTEWLHFLDKQERAVSVARGVMAYDTCNLCQLLQSFGVDTLYLSTFCVTRWMSPAKGINKAKNNSFKNSVKLFVDNGLQHWDEFVASCLIAHISSVTQDGTELAPRMWEISYSSLVPLPSSLFAELLLRPFTLCK
ncbi:unnamed protein product [Phytomonas sp. Hart1]|nr:unnamed protein product [Phytomonas sp. Hart1]|eukprot:CCW68774.1 unnamed protein product [Phytomonas sp. isolate Hart1]